MSASTSRPAPRENDGASPLASPPEACDVNDVCKAVEEGVRGPDDDEHQEHKPTDSDNGRVNEGGKLNEEGVRCHGAR